MNNSSPGSLKFRWLGVAGLDIRYNGQVLLIDPYVTRIPFVKMWLGSVKSDLGLIKNIIEKPDYILITHSHFDHLMDVPAIMKIMGGSVFGSRNTCEILEAYDIDKENIHLIGPGQSFKIGGFVIKSFEGFHGRAPGFGPGEIKGIPKPPLSARQFRMDIDMQFKITAGDTTFITAGEGEPDDSGCDILFCHPRPDKNHFKRIINQLRPKTIIFTHWEDFYRPLSEPPVPFFVLPNGFPYLLKRLDLKAIIQLINEIDSKIRVVIPHPLGWYTVTEDKTIEKKG